MLALVVIPPQHRLLLFVLVLLAALSGATAFLASVHHQMRGTQAAQHLDHGHALSSRGELAEAVQEYRTALSLEREHPEAARALALTLLSLGRIAEAESYLRELLRQYPTDGALNRGLARIHTARGREAEARAAYQRAIYGEWPGNGAEARIETRFELIEFLSSRNAREERVAELLRLSVELPAGQTAVARRVADALAQQGAPELALEVLRGAAAAAPEDVELLAHLAALETDTGDAAAARATLRRAVAQEPARRDLREQLTMVERVLTLDPTLPGLGLVTRTRRARTVLAAVVEQTRTCAEAPSAPLEVLALSQDAARRLRLRARADAEAAEQELELAARLWELMPDCHGTSAEARALAQVLQHVMATSEPRT
jgi:tetratricopeptide (TPR) repeat protein